MVQGIGSSIVTVAAWMLLWCGFNPRSRNFHMPWGQPKKKKKKIRKMNEDGMGGTLLSRERL